MAATTEDAVAYLKGTEESLSHALIMALHLKTITTLTELLLMTVIA